MMKRMVLLAAAAAAVMAVGCRGARKSAEVPVVETLDFVDKDSGATPYSVEVSYCRIADADSDPVWASIERQNYEHVFGAEAPADIDAAVQMVIDGFVDDFVAYDEGEPHSFEYQLGISQDNELVRGGAVMCYTTYYYMYTGGAHGMGTVAYDCYDMASGQRYDFHYLMEDVWAPAVRQLVSNKLNGDYGDDLFGITPETAYVSAAVKITDNGILIDYQPYEVAPYCMGIVSVALSDEEIAATGAPVIWRAE
ncbi:MAG: RsiV family protein [Alistipes sp.]|nr:RsiV family protein [Alistipes sp.]